MTFSVIIHCVDFVDLVASSYMRYYAAILIGHITCLARPSVCPSVRPFRTGSQFENKKKHRKTEIGVNAPQIGSNRVYQFSQIKVIGQADGCTMCQHRADKYFFTFSFFKTCEQASLS